MAKLLGQDRWVRKHEILREMHYCTEAHQNNSALLKDIINNFEVRMSELEIRGIANCRVLINIPKKMVSSVSYKYE